MNKSNPLDTVLNLLSKHPYICAFIICIAINPFFLGAIENIPNNALYLESFLMSLGIVGFGWYKYHSGIISKRQCIIFIILVLCANFIGLKYHSKSENKAIWYFIGGCLILLWICLYSGIKKYKDAKNSLLIIGIGFFLKLYYVLGTSVYTRQHDVNRFGAKGSGHAGYIEYLLFNHHLPDFDVRNKWQYYHPPLHHTISAIWIYINEDILKIGHNQARESLQTLTLFYSICIIITAYRILKHLKLKGFALYIPLIIISFHPAFILFSGSINNDVLSVAFILGAILCTLKWIENQTLKNIIKIALCVGLGMMTKISAALVAPPIALVFLIIFIKKFKKNALKLFGQFCAFGILCVPLGLWFGIRNYVNWKIPLTYVQEMNPKALQNIGNQNFLSRITDFSPKQFSSVFEQWVKLDSQGKASGYNEYNPLVALLKNSIFGEYINEKNFASDSFALKISTVLFWTATVIAAAALVCLIIMMFKKCSMGKIEKAFFGSFYAITMFNFYKMANDYPFTCTMNFRYITPTVIIGALFIGIALDKLHSHSNKSSTVITAVSTGIVSLFAMCVTIVYLAVCVP